MFDLFPTKANFTVFWVMVRQVGLFSAARITLAKMVNKAMNPGARLCYGQTAEDIVLEFLIEKYLGKKNFIFVDVGCNNPRYISNTYYHYLRGSTGLNIDLNARFAEEYIKRRPKDLFVCAAVSDRRSVVDIHEYERDEVATISKNQAEIWNERWRATGLRQVESVTLAELLLEKNFDKIDVLLLDVEGSELEVLGGAKLNVYRPVIIVCEIHALEVDAVRETEVYRFLHQENYRLVAFATMNGYFIRGDILDENSARNIL